MSKQKPQPAEWELLGEYALWCNATNPSMYSKMCWWHDKTTALQAELAQVKAERDQIAEEVKHNVLNWGRVEANERLCRDLAAGLRILQIIIRASGGGLVGYNGRTAHEWAREFDALLSRPEVVKMLEEREAGRG